MPGLTAKVFRTYNASYTMGRVLNEIKDTGGTIAEKVKAYNDANRKVAILCNHKRTVTAGHANAMEKMGERVSFLYSAWFKGRGAMLIYVSLYRSRAFGTRSGG
jgi:DNA topoisomerase-1